MRTTTPTQGINGIGHLPVDETLEATFVVVVDNHGPFAAEQTDL